MSSRRPNKPGIDGKKRALFKKMILKGPAPAKPQKASEPIKRSPVLPPIKLGSGSRNVSSFIKESKRESANTMNATLSSALREETSRALKEAGYAELASALSHASDLDFSRVGKKTVRQWVSDTVLAKTSSHSEARRKLEKALAELPEGLTLEEMLGTNLELRDHPLFSSAVSREKISDLLSISSALTPAARASFVELVENFQGSGEEFWKAVKAKPELAKPQAIQELQRLFQLDVLSGRNLALIQSLEKSRAKGEWKNLRDLTSWDEAKWDKLVRAAGVDDESVLTGIGGNTREEKLSAYSKRISESLRLAFPLESLRKKFEKAKDPAGPLSSAIQKGISQVLAKAQDLDLAKEHLESYLKNHPQVLSGIQNPDEVKQGLKSVQRVFKITHDADKAKILLDTGLDSAHAITNISWPNFARDFSQALGGEAEARAYYIKASKAVASSAAVLGAISQGVWGVSPSAVGQVDPDIFKDALKDVPTLANLFGSMDLCDCKHCASVYGPAAYLVDLLQFLRKANVGKQANALDFLRARRPDIEHLKLNCENTNTALPYIDLVNEILEYCVVAGKVEKQAVHDTEGMLAEELDVNPQYVNDAAYEKLSEAVFPAALPFNRPVEISRGYLDHLGSSRFELLTTFRKGSTPSSLAIAAEYLKIDENEIAVLTNAQNKPVRLYYGYSTQNFGGQPWTQDIAKVPSFMRRTGSTFDDVVELLKTRFLNASKNMIIDLPAGETDVQKMKITNFTEAKLDKAHRFIRLRQKLGWTIEELDSALHSLQATDITNAVLKKLSAIAQLKAELRAKLPSLLSFWANIETHGDRALYPKLFLNKAVFNPVDKAFELNTSASEVKTTGSIAEHAPAIMAALGVKAQDFAAIRETCNLATDANNDLKIKNLSALYRHAMLAKNLRMPVRDFLVLVALVGSDPFADPDATLAFVRKARKVQKSKFKPAQLDYLFRHHWDPARPYAPTEETVALFLKQLHQGLKNIWDETVVPEDPSGEILLNKLAAVLESTLITDAMQIIDGSSTLTVNEQDLFIEDHFAIFVNPADVQGAFLGFASLPDEERKQARIGFILKNLMAYLRDSLAKSFIVQSLAARFGIDPDVMRVLVLEILQSQANPGAALVTDFLPLMEALPDPIDAQLADYRLLHKIALIANGFKITPVEASYLQNFGTDFGGFNWNAIPMAPEQFTPTHFAQWERLFNLFELRERTPESEAKLTDVFAAADKTAALEALRKATGWDVPEMEFVAGPDGLNLQAASFKNEIALTKLEACIRLASRIGLSSKQLFDWAGDVADSTQAKDIIKTVRAKYEDNEWLLVGKSLNDKLREMQRQALVAYLLPRTSGVETPNQMFEHFLIDVNMNPVMKTSRIKQAISAVQTFIQRVLMNLENGVPPQVLDADRWEWMKNYRVWEANRKVFLYPENWIEPELRDDKSPFFRELEAELLQNDLNLASAESAFMNYLEKLDEVSRLHMCGIYHHVEFEDGITTDVLHAFGRTFNSPYNYYYRSYSFQTNHWTPWEKINIDIDAEHLMPMVFNRRLYLFWPLFEEKTAEGPKNSEGETQSRGYWQVKLAWSEYRNGKWTAKKTTKDFLTSWPAESDELVPPPLDKHFFKGFIYDNPNAYGLHIYLYIDLKTSNNTSTSISTVMAGYFTFEDTVGEYTYYDRGDSSGGTFISAPCPEGGQLKYESYQSSGDFKIPQYNPGQVTVLNSSASGFRMLLPHDLFQDSYEGFFPFFYEDNKRVYFVSPKFDGPEPKMTIPSMLLDPGTFSMKFDKKSASKKTSSSTKPAEEELITVGSSSSSFGGNYKFSPDGAQAKASTKSSKKIVLNSFGSITETTAKSGDIQLATGQINLIDVQINPVVAGILMQKLYLHFETFFHPHTIDFIRGINRKGLKGLLTLENQKLKNDQPNTTVFEQVYNPTEFVHWDRPEEIVDFTTGSPYAIYNWELFFHIPLLIATSLVREGRHDDAFYWFHTIFNPTTDSSDPSPRRYWNMLPFYKNAYPGKEQIQQMLKALAYKGTTNQSLLKQKQEVQKQVEEWRSNPFNPHAIARMRLTAYQKNVVMRYIDALIGKGDQLFSMDTIETINEATQCYVLAANMLGPKPEEIPALTKPEAKTFDQIKNDLDSFSNAMVAVENEFPFSEEESGAQYFYMGKMKENNFSLAKKNLQFEQIDNQNDFKLSPKKPDLEIGPVKPPIGKGNLPPMQTFSPQAFYFCIPRNEKLLSYWDTVSDRLFKIRHGLNIEGIERPLALFEPPIDPALLVRARAMGLDLSSVLSDLRAPSPRCRFSYMIQKALELCGEVKTLGNALLGALEKKDAEELNQMRQRHELSALRAAREVKKRQIEDARQSLYALQKQRDVTNTRYNYYKNIVYKNSQESRYIEELEKARTFQQMAQASEAIGGQLSNIPDFTTGSSGMGPVAETTFGGSNLAKAAGAMASAYNFFAGIHTHNGTMASIIGGWQRRWDDWKLQERLASKELLQIDKQILGAEIRVDVSERELENHDLQVANAEEVESFLIDKFSSKDLYGWMVSRISSVYFQVYKLAYDLSKKAERAWQIEYGTGNESFVKFGYWDSLKKGLLSGEEMWLDLKRMEAAAFEAPRDYELTKHVSLLQFAPMALVSLKETGKCEFVLPEELFALDYLGHYNRRIKSVSITIPCVAGPYTNINATLTLLENKIRVNASTADGFAELEDEEEDPRFVHNYGPVQSVATSTAQNDTGMFDLNFRDEKFLPFEGAGVASRWRLELRKEANAFDLDTMSDVILSINYRAREGGEVLAKAAKEAVISEPQENLVRLFSMKHEFPMEWHRFLNPVVEATEQTLELDLKAERFPFYLRGRELAVSEIEVLLKLKPSSEYPGGGQPLKLSITAPEGIPVEEPLPSVASLLNGIPRGVFDMSADSAGFGVWTISAKEADVKLMDAELRETAGPGSSLQRLNSEIVDDLWVLVKYSAE